MATARSSGSCAPGPARTGTTGQFIDLAEQISGQQLGELFNTWLYTIGKPSVGPNGVTLAAIATAEPKLYKRIEETDWIVAGKGR